MGEDEKLYCESCGNELFLSAPSKFALKMTGRVTLHCLNCDNFNRVERLPSGELDISIADKLSCDVTCYTGTKPKVNLTYVDYIDEDGEESIGILLCVKYVNGKPYCIIRGGIFTPDDLAEIGLEPETSPVVCIYNEDRGILQYAYDYDEFERIVLKNATVENRPPADLIERLSYMF